MIVKSKNEAWLIADKLFPTDYKKDEFLSERAGYPTYESTSSIYKGRNAYINDLGCRLEVVIDNDVFNIWIEEPTEGKTPLEELKDVLSNEIKARHIDLFDDVVFFYLAGLFPDIDVRTCVDAVTALRHDFLYKEDK